MITELLGFVFQVYTGQVDLVPAKLKRSVTAPPPGTGRPGEAAAEGGAWLFREEPHIGLTDKPVQRSRARPAACTGLSPTLLSYLA